MQLKLFQEFLQTVDKYQAFVVNVTDVARFPSDASADEQKFTLSKAIEVTDVLCVEVPATTPKDAQLFTVLLPMSTTISRYALRKSSVPLRRVFSYIAGSEIDFAANKTVFFADQTTQAEQLIADHSFGSNSFVTFTPGLRNVAGFFVCRNSHVQANIPISSALPLAHAYPIFHTHLVAPYPFVPFKAPFPSPASSRRRPRSPRQASRARTPSTSSPSPPSTAPSPATPTTPASLPKHSTSPASTSASSPSWDRPELPSASSSPPSAPTPSSSAAAGSSRRPTSPSPAQLSAPSTQTPSRRHFLPPPCPPVTSLPGPLLRAHAAPPPAVLRATQRALASLWLAPASTPFTLSPHWPD